MPLLGSVGATTTTATPNFLVPNGTIVVELIIFIIVLGIVARFILPPVQRAMAERSERIRGALEAGEEGRGEADRLERARRAKLDEARTEARRILEVAQRAAEEKREAARQRGQAEYDRLFAAAQGSIEGERQATIEAVASSLESLVVDAATRIVGQPVDAARHRGAIERVRAELGAGEGVGMPAVIFATGDNFGLSFILEIVGLALVVLFVVRKVVPPLRKVMQDKRDEITGQLSAGDEARAAAAELVASRQAALDAAGAEAAAIVEQARKGAELLDAEGDHQAQEEYERIVRRAASAIEAARASVRSEIMVQVGRLVLAAATDVVEAELDDTAQRRLIGEAISATEAEVH